MVFQAILFFLAATGAIVGAVAVVMLKNPFFAVLALVCHLFALAVLFLLLYAQFLAAAQLIVYAGAVMVLYVFVVSYVGGAEYQLVASSGISDFFWNHAGTGLFYLDGTIVSFVNKRGDGGDSES
mgnify:CR=1 FL=1